MPEEPLAEARRLQREAAETGFDWNHADELWAKLDEEIAELKEASQQGQERKLDELGDLLFVTINLARHLNIDPVVALTHANAKFRRRFDVVLQGDAQWKALQGAERIAQMERLWQLAKARGL